MTKQFEPFTGLLWSSRLLITYKHIPEYWTY